MTTQTQTWTPERVKQELPPVLVKMPDGTIRPGIVAGRTQEFASVGVDGEIVGLWAWKAVARALTNNRPLKV